MSSIHTNSSAKFACQYAQNSTSITSVFVGVNETEICCQSVTFTISVNTSASVEPMPSNLFPTILSLAPISVACDFLHQTAIVFGTPAVHNTFANCITSG